VQKALAFKLGVIALIALLLLIPLFMVQAKISERAIYQESARNQVAQSWTGAQRLMTPVVVLPYLIEQRAAPSARQGFVTDNPPPPRRVTRYQIVAPDTVSVSGELETEFRRLGIYRIPVYTTKLEMAGQVVGQRLLERRQSSAELPGFIEHLPPYLSLVLSDPRGIGEVPALNWRRGSLDFIPGTGIPGVDAGIRALLPEPDAGAFDFKLALTLRGMERLQIIPAGLETRVSMGSAWPHPMFTGAFLPGELEVDHDGFMAGWRVNQFSSDISARISACGEGRCEALDGAALGVMLIDPVDVYLKSERATKYGLLFVGLSFIVFFVFEVMRELRIHPIQYTLVGLAISVFYLLLISLSEHIAFGAAYALAAAACIAVLLYYVKHILDGWRGAWLFAAMLSALYAVLYVILQAEDYALLGGAALVFAVLAIVMVATREIDWYGVGGNTATRPEAEASQ
jgi:inner membrane protein